IPIEQVEREVGESKVVLEDRLGTAVHTFAYPYGKFNARVRKIAGQHFQATCSTRLGRAGHGCDLHALQRIDVYYLRDLKMLARMESGTFDLYLQFRQGLRDVKGFLKRD
ncbi:MAG TPA: polysaccharide deacetylase family protein, partial [Abditibacteriaceae bacterium]|nr:polysaccharide deacetylase family protein [Abditibacteriaceae bacterium]